MNELEPVKPRVIINPKTIESEMVISASSYFYISKCDGLALARILMPHMKARNEEGASRGKKFHSIMENWEVGTDHSLIDEKDELIVEYVDRIKTREYFPLRIEKANELALVQERFSRRGVIALSGQIDTAYYEPDSNTVTIVDYKTAQYINPADFEQMKIYISLVMRSIEDFLANAGLEPKSIKAKIQRTQVKGLIDYIRLDKQFDVIMSAETSTEFMNQVQMTISHLEDHILAPREKTPGRKLEYMAGPHCNSCAFNGKCPVHANASEAAILALKDVTDVTLLTNQQKVEALDKIKGLIKQLDARKVALQDSLIIAGEAGIEVTKGSYSIQTTVRDVFSPSLFQEKLEKESFGKKDWEKLLSVADISVNKKNLEVLVENDKIRKLLESCFSKTPNAGYVKVKSGNKKSEGE